MPPSAEVSVTRNFTKLFQKARSGDRSAGGLVYSWASPRLRDIAKKLLRKYNGHDTLQPADLVGEMYLKTRGFQLRILGRDHFFRISARAMRQVLTDRGRKRQFERSRHAEVSQQLLDEQRIASPELRCMMRNLVDELRRIDSEGADIVWLRSVEGWTWEEISQKTGRPVWAVRADGEFALQWLRERLRS